MPPKLDVDSIICNVLNSGHTRQAFSAIVPLPTLTTLLVQAKAIFMSQPAMVEVEPPVKLCGDTHGQFGDVLRLLDRGGFPPLVNYLFLGDYVDRGHHNLEVIVLFLAYKIKYPKNFFLLRGNHECAPINRVYGFYEEVQRRYGNPKAWNQFQDTFACMPLTGLVAGKVLCMHGGLSEQLKSLDDLRAMPRPMPNTNANSFAMDLLWADPDDGTEGFADNTRGVSCVFGPDVVKEKCAALGIDLVVRAHQVVQDGYEFFANRKLVTIFSAPHYCGQFDNAAAILNIDEGLSCSFHIIRPTTKLSKIRPAN